MSTDLIGLADHPALDFLNSTATPIRETIEFLRDGQAYLDWLMRADLIDAADRDHALDRFGAGELDAVAEEAIGMRERLRPAVAGWATVPDSVPPADILDLLNRILAIDDRFAQVRSGADGRTVIRERRRWLDARQLLVPPVEAAARLFVSADPNLVRECEGPTCTLWFYDQTKSHRRRWCSMAVCGNRAKARHHRQRERAHAD